LPIYGTAVVPAFGCVLQQRPASQFPAGTRVGIVSRLENFITHQNFNELRFGSFSKTYELDWNLPAYANDYITRLLGVVID
jgi:hypothetical protein